jgi:hypothetical protein
MRHDLRARIEKLESRTRPGMVIMWKHHSETDEEAKARWKRENPGQDPEAAGIQVMLVRWADPT